MKRVLILTTLALVLSSTANVYPQRKVSEQSIESHLKQLEHEWHEAIRTQNIAALERILAPEYTLTVAIEGEPLEVTKRSDYLEACKGFYVIHSFKFDELLVRVYGDIAVVSSRYSQKATLGGTRDRSANFFLVDTWQRKNGRWQVVARYSSRPEKPERSK